MAREDTIGEEQNENMLNSDMSTFYNFGRHVRSTLTVTAFSPCRTLLLKAQVSCIGGLFRAILDASFSHVVDDTVAMETWPL